MNIFDLLVKVPDVVWSGLLASVITLAGVMLSNWSNTKRLIRQLSHDADEKKKDRIHAMRRDVYLKAAEELTKASNYLGRMTQLDPSTTNIADGMSDFFAISAKLQLVAQPETSRLAAELTTRYGEISMNLLGKAIPVHNLNAEIRLSGEFYDKNQSEVSRIIAEMTRLNESGEATPERFAALERSLESPRMLADHFAERRSKAFSLLEEILRDYNIELLREIRTVGPTQAQLMAAIREEIGLDADMKSYREGLEENWMRLDKSMQGLMEEMKKDEGA